MTKAPAKVAKPRPGRPPLAGEAMLTLQIRITPQMDAELEAEIALKPLEGKSKSALLRELAAEGLAARKQARVRKGK